MFHNLTEPQQQAVKTIDGPLLILAGPGSGKTRVVTHRTAYMVEQGINPRRILTLTFTNKAADEMDQRIQNLVPGTNVWTSTFHKFCSRMLREYGGFVGLEENFTIYDTTDSKKALKQAIEEHNVELYKYSESQLLNKISELKNQLHTHEEFQARPGAPLDAIVEKVYPLYQKRLIQSNAVDFDDLLMHVAKLLMANTEVREELDERYQYIAVDEYQDTNYAQYMILKMLSVHQRNLAVTGDPDQSIYGWRGANIRNILDFEKDFPETRVVRLEQNYRSTPNILAVADHLIAYNSQRKEKHLFTDKPDGLPVRLVAYPSQKDEAEQIAEQIYTQINTQRRQPQDIAIFYRTNALSRTLEHSLRTMGVPYQIVKGHEFYQRKEVKDVLAYLHLINNPRNDVAFERIINVPARKIGKVTIDRLKNFAYVQGICLLEAAIRCNEIETLKGVARSNVRKFADMMLDLREAATELVSTIIGKIFIATGYRETLLSTGNPEDEERAANLDELFNAAHEFDQEYGAEGGLDVYLDQASLVSDVDAWEKDDNKVTLMTMHAAKGLEFPVVYIVALEDGILPHARSMESDSEIEEERRLLFVGITRAEEELQMSRALYRSKKGRLWPTIPSTFLMELPRETMEVHEPRRSGFGGNEFGDTENYDPGNDDEYFSDSQYEEPVYQDADQAPPEPTNADQPDNSNLSDSFSDDVALDDVPFDVFESDDSDGSNQRVEESPEPFPIQSPNSSSEPSTENPDRRQRSAPSAIAKLQPASTLAKLDQQEQGKSSATADGENSGITFPPNAFAPNMLVSHDEYGVGRILNIGKAGSKETATVEFVSIGKKTFVLKFAKMRPLVESKS